ncbi:MAG TPA: tRNA (adenosine(37)-N6)-threonylcarbamoyltransferase complex dimerization subunit type 1 TsaB [Clostridiales bacterium]|nr:tRNA (adenosine(37)-N6)-threonylcarbamoyltransferase complex dimerization subunit type 1 TsaB [Clostridiales bacterium]
MKQLKLLAIETTGPFASAALLTGRETVLERVSDRRQSHLSMLIPLIDQLIRESGLQKNELTNIAVSEGPGSFTGIRIGIATARGLAVALGLPLTAVPTLRSFLWKSTDQNAKSTDQNAKATDQNTWCCPLFDARRQQVYTGIYEVDRQLGRTILSDRAIAFEELLQEIDRLDPERKRAIRFYGDGLDRFSEQILSWRADNDIWLAPPEERYQNAAATARCAARLISQGRAVAPALVEPVYLRQAEAERKLAEKKTAPAAVVLHQTMDEDKVVLRQATDKDAARMAELDELCFSRPWSRRSFDAELAADNQTALYLVLEANDRIIAYAGLWKIIDEGHITNVAVRPDRRRRGHGRQLVGELLRIAGTMGIESFTLEVRSSNLAAIKLYESFDFVVAGCRKEYYEDNGEDALIMWRREESGREK